MNVRVRAIVAVAASSAFLLFSAGAPASAVTASPSPSPAASNPPTAASLLAQAQLDAASGRNQQARDEATHVLQLDPHNSTALRLLGDVEYRLQHYAAAERAYDTLLAANPKDRDLHNRLGGVYAAEGRIDEAITEFKLSLPLQEGTMNLVELYREQGRLGELESEDRAALDVTPGDDPGPRFELAWVLGAEKKYNEAIALYQQALLIKPDFYEARNGLGIIYGEMGHYPEAISQYQQAISIEPKCYQCWMNWGVELRNSGDPKGAIEKIEHALSINAQFGLAYMNLGVAYDDQGEFQKAIELYERALTYDPRVPEVYINLGSDYFDHGLMNLAEAAFIKGIAISPRDARLHLALGYYYQNRAEYKKAIEQYKLAETYDPTDPRAKSYLAQAEAQAGQ